MLHVTRHTSHVTGAIVYRWNKENQDEEGYAALQEWLSLFLLLLLLLSSPSSSPSSSPPPPPSSSLAGVVVDKEPIKPKLVGAGK